MREDLPVWRSLMFVPVNVEKFVNTGADRGADGIILDLEDAVAPSQKDHARTLIADAIPQVARNGADVLVRVNRPWRMLVRDIEAAVIPGVAALMLTKVDSPEHVLAVAEIVDELEAERNLPAGRMKFVALVETAAWLLPHGGDRQVPSAHRRPEPGIGGFRRRCRHAIRTGGAVLSQAAHAVRRSGGRHHADGVRRLDRRLPRPGRIPRHRAPLAPAGILCASAIHPLQVPVLNEEFSPDPAEVERAEQMVAAYDDAYARGLGAVQFEGAMIDVPVVERARSVVNRARALQGKVRA